jgi:hypothetical protein
MIDNPELQYSCQSQATGNLEFLFPCGYTFDNNILKLSVTVLRFAEVKTLHEALHSLQCVHAVVMWAVPCSKDYSYELGNNYTEGS